MNTRVLLSAALVVALHASGCESPSMNEPDGPPYVSSRVEALSLAYEPGANLSATEVVALTETVWKAINESPDIASAHDRADEAVQGLPPLQRDAARQVAAATLLHSLYEMPATEANRALAAKNAEVLVVLESPEADLIARSLDYVGDLWTLEQRRNVARSTLQVLEAQQIRRESTPLPEEVSRVLGDEVSRPAGQDAEIVRHLERVATMS